MIQVLCNGMTERGLKNLMLFFYNLNASSKSLSYFLLFSFSLMSKVNLLFMFTLGTEKLIFERLIVKLIFERLSKTG